jgi:hypothetical protein
LTASVLVLLVAASPAHAFDMDPTFVRLRVPANEGSCGAPDFCPADELFERLVGELGAAFAPPIRSSARTLGVVNFYLGLETTVTSIDSEQAHWVLGTKGEGNAPEGNASPAGALVVPRVAAHKGLPFGLEAGVSLARALDTALWAFSGELRWTVFEAPRRSAWPDVALRGSLGSAVGAAELDLMLGAGDVTLSKSIPLASAWTLAPLAGVQALYVSAESADVDLTPSTSAPSRAMSFAPVDHLRWRFALGALAAHAAWRMGASLNFDLVPPSIEARPRSTDRASRLWALDVSVGAVL